MLKNQLVSRTKRLARRRPVETQSQGSWQRQEDLQGSTGRRESSMGRSLIQDTLMRWGKRSQWKADCTWEEGAGRVEWTDPQPGRWRKAMPSRRREEARAVKSSGAGGRNVRVQGSCQGSCRAGRWKQARG